MLTVIVLPGVQPLATKCDTPYGNDSVAGAFIGVGTKAVCTELKPQPAPPPLSLIVALPPPVETGALIVRVSTDIVIGTGELT